MGAVLLDKNKEVKALGHHKGKGTNHAEIEILNMTQIEEDDVLYVTLEPCLHTDTSPSCADELLNTNLKNRGNESDRSIQGHSQCYPRK